MNLQEALFAIICLTHSNDSSFLVVLLFWKESETNGIIQSFVLYFLWFILFMRASVGGGQYWKSYKEAFNRRCRHKARKLQQVNKSRTSLQWNGPKMKANTVATILLVSFLVTCLMIDESYGVIGILGAARNSAKHKETYETSQSQEERPSSQRKGGMRASSFERKRPDRFPEGPMFDKRSRNRFYNY